MWHALCVEKPHATSHASPEEQPERNSLGNILISGFFQPGLHESPVIKTTE